VNLRTVTFYGLVFVKWELFRAYVWVMQYFAGLTIFFAIRRDFSLCCVFVLLQV
jgi:hypothetical protein